MLTLSNPTDRETLADLIKSDINSFCEKEYQQGHRDHLGASLMGEECNRKLWYNFRWVKKEEFDGRMLRLFQVGHQAEPRFIKYLEGIGFEVRQHDPETKKQFRISGCDGHYGGSLDGMCKAPTRYNLSEDLIWLNEFKTNGTGAGFSNVAKNGVQKEKPKHYKQMAQYGKHYGLKYGLYLIENKNDSDLTVEIVELDWNVGIELEHKAQDIISAKTPPARIAENPSYFDCKYCSYAKICFENAPVEINCRSCKYCEPVKDGQWFCNRWKAIVPKDAILKACPEHQSVNG